MSLERRMGSRLVGPHHAGVSGDVSADYGSQAPVHLSGFSSSSWTLNI
jgi:hypothetical protein